MTTEHAKAEDCKLTTPASVAKAKILKSEPGTPVQLILPARDAADLAFIAEDFSRSVITNGEDAKRLVGAATVIAAMLRNCLVARTTP